MREYTLAQVRGYLEAIDRANRRAALAATISARAAQADRAGFQTYLRALKADE